MTIVAAFDRALREVDLAGRRGLHTREGESAAPLLAALREALERERETASARGAIDVAAIGALVRGVADWYPEDQVQLIAALGAIVREAGGRR